MSKVIFISEKCKGCKLCIEFCPKRLLEIDKSKVNEKGYYAVKITDESICTGCASCATMCPDCAIEIER